MNDFLGVVEYNFKLWMHLQNALEINAFEYHIHAIEVKITKKK
jgi:hypothetical protein